MAYKRILVSTDGSRLSQKALEEAIVMASEMKAELFIVNVIPHFQQYFFENISVAVRDAEVERLQKIWADESNALLEAAKKFAEEKGVTAKTIATHSKMVSKGIIKTAKANAIDLIVMASHGRKGLARMLIGSETNQVLIHSPVPVLVVR